MHGVTKSVSFPVSAERVGSEIDVLADITIPFSEWNIANPSIGGFVTTANSGTLEVLLHLTQGAGNPASTSSGSSGLGRWRRADHGSQHDRSAPHRPFGLTRRSIQASGRRSRIEATMSAEVPCHRGCLPWPPADASGCFACPPTLARHSSRRQTSSNWV